MLTLRLHRPRLTVAVSLLGGFLQPRNDTSRGDLRKSLTRKGEHGHGAKASPNRAFEVDIHFIS